MVVESELEFYNSYNMAAVIPNVSRISSRIIRVLGCNPGPMTLQGTNTYIIGTGKRRILLDTGDADEPQYINHLKSVLHNENIDLAHIFISHWHHDHLGGITDVMDLKNYTKYCQVWKYPREDDDLPKHINFDYLKDGQEFSVEGATLRVLHTPGHTSDHVVFHLLEENAILSGDCILGEGTAVFEDLRDYMSSLDAILDIQPSIIYPGHGNIVHNPVDKIKFYIDHRHQRELQIIELLKNNTDEKFTPLDIVSRIYIQTPQKLFQAAAVNVEHHLTKLQKEGKVTGVNGKWQFMDGSKL